MIKRSLVLILMTLVFVVPAAAQTGIQFPHSLVVNEQTVQAALQQAAQAPAPATQTAAGQPTQGPRVPVTIDEAVKMALDRNLDIAVQRLNRATFDVAIQSIQAFYSPTITSTLSTTSQTTSTTNTLAGGNNAGATINTDTSNFNGGLVQNIQKGGGNLSVNFNNTRQTSTNLTSFYNPQFNGLLSAIYTQPLLRNFKIDSNRQALIVSKLNADISDLQVQQTVTNTVANIRSAYWDYVFAIQSVEVARQSLSLAEELVKNNQTKVEIGTLAPIDVVQSQTQAAAQRQALVTAEGTVRTAEIALKRLIVSGTNDPLWGSSIDPVDRPTFAPEPVDVNAAIQKALANRTDVLQAKKNLEANEVTIDLLQNQTLPQADLVGRYQSSGVGGTQLITEGTGVTRVVTGSLPGGYFDALRMLGQAKLPTWQLQMNISYPLGMSATKAAVARAKIQQQEVDAQLRQIDLQVATDVSNAGVNVENNAERVQAAQVARQLAQQQLDAENSKFGVGMSTNFLVVQAQRDLATAQNNELQAILAYRKALVEFDRVQQTGTAGNITIIGR